MVALMAHVVIFSVNIMRCLYILTLVMLDYNGSVVLGGAASKPFCFLHVCSQTSPASIKSHHLQFAGVVEHPILGNHCVGVQRLGVHLIVIVPEHNLCWLIMMIMIIMPVMIMVMLTMMILMMALMMILRVAIVLTGWPG